MIPYIVLLSIIIFSFIILRPAIIDESPEGGYSFDKRALILSFIAITLLAGLRSYSVGADTSNYVSNFLRTRNNSLILGDLRFEIGYQYYVKFVALITGNAQIFLLITAAIVNGLYARFIYKYSKSLFLSTIFYVTIGHFLFQLSGIRQAMAMAICTFAIDYALERKPIKFVIAVVIASLFHSSALVYIPIYLMTGKVSRKTGLISIMSLVVIVLFGDRLFQYAFNVADYEKYGRNVTVATSGGWTIIIILSFTLLLTIINNSCFDRSNIDREDQFFLFLLTIGLGLYILRYQMRAAERVSNYFRIALIILLPNSLTRLPDDRAKTMIEFVSCLLCIGLFFYWINGSTYYYTFFIR